MQTLYFKDYKASRRRVYFQLNDQTDGVTPEAGEAGGQPSISKLGAAAVTTDVGVLVATDAAKGLYYSELGEGALDTIGRHRMIYDSGNTAVADEVIEVVPHPYLHDGLAQAGGSSSITLEGTASAVNDFYNDAYVVIIDGTGKGQVRQVTDYVGATKVATVDQGWVIIPDATSVYLIEPGSRLASLDSIWDTPTVDHVVAGSFGEVLAPVRRGTAQGGGSNQITLDALASAVDNFYKGQIVRIVGGTGAGQSNIIASYSGGTKQATVAANWATIPDNSSVFVLYPFGPIPGATAPTAGEVADAVWDEALAGHVIANTFGAGLRLDSSMMPQIADSILKRHVSGGEDDTIPTVEFALCFLAGKWTDNGNGTITVYKGDDVTPLGTISFSTVERGAIGGIDSSGGV